MLWWLFTIAGFCAQARLAHANADYVVVFSTAAACEAHDMSEAHLILRPPDWEHDGVSASCEPTCSGTAMGFVSSECVPQLLASAGGTRMTLYHSLAGCEAESENDIVRIVFNLDDCFTISNGESLTILSSGTEGGEICSIQMRCTLSGGGASATLLGYASEDCAASHHDKAVSSHTAQAGHCVEAPGMGFTRYSCPEARKSAVTAGLNTSLSSESASTPEQEGAGVAWGIAGAALGVTLLAGLYYSCSKQ